MKLRNIFLTLLAGLSLLLSPCFAPSPGFTSPFVLATIPLQFALEWMGYGHWLDGRYEAVILTLPVLFFFAWNPRLLCGQIRTPKRTYVLVFLGVALGAANLIGSWSYGVRWQGVEYTLFVSAESVACMAMLCILLFFRWKDEPSFVWNLALHWLFFAWLAWFAFPYLGEPI